jgi:hypothetical protein
LIGVMDLDYYCSLMILLESILTKVWPAPPCLDLVESEPPIPLNPLIMLFWSPITKGVWDLPSIFKFYRSSSSSELFNNSVFETLLIALSILPKMLFKVLGMASLI